MGKANSGFATYSPHQPSPKTPRGTFSEYFSVSTQIVFCLRLSSPWAQGSSLENLQKQPHASASLICTVETVIVRFTEAWCETPLVFTEI